MTKQPLALKLAEVIDTFNKLDESLPLEMLPRISTELRRLHEENVELLTIIKDLQESASYWCDYEVPVGIVERMNAAIEQAHDIGDKT
jgi:hypothetical protein